MTTLEAANDALRQAVETRLAGTIPSDLNATNEGRNSPLAGCQPAQECAAKVLSDAWSAGSCCEGQRQRETYAEWEPGFQGGADRPGTTAKFGTGAVRSDTFEEFRYDLVSPIGLREVARACAEGAEKYGDWNWEKGMPVHDLLNHAIAHIYEFLSGDRGEPHLGHAAWNVLAAIHSHELWPHLNYPGLRRPGCVAPDENGP